MGFVLNSKLLIVAGALDGASGFILSVNMSKAMNRSFSNVLFGAFGQEQAGHAGAAETRSVRSATAEEAASILAAANKVVIVPGYGMAVAQAQHKVRELYDALTKRGVDVKFGIHPVAGRMPGHMNVLLPDRGGQRRAASRHRWDQSYRADVMRPRRDSDDGAGRAYH